MKKIICLIMTMLLFCATCVPVMAEAQEIEGSGITWELTDNGTTLTISGTGDMPNFTFRASRPWHSAADTITTVKIDSGVTSIGMNSFFSCTNLQSITIPSDITSIGNSAFQNCQSLQSITIPSSVTSIGNNAFQNCQSLQSITIPSGVTSIGNSAFQNCKSLQSITIPSTVTIIGMSAFQNCQSLQSITIPSTVTSIGESAFNGCQRLQSITIPSSVKSISDSAFMSCQNLQSITIPASVTSIGNSAFSGCQNLQSISIPLSVTSIGDSAFKGCQRLQSITIPSSVTSIGDSAFQDCINLQSITIPSSVKSIGTDALKNCASLANLTFRSSTPPRCLGTVQLSGTTVYVPHGAIDAYKTNITWDASTENSISEAYMVDILPAQNGTITVSNDFFPASKYKEASETVIVDAIPNEGYQLKSLTYSDAETTTDITEDMSFTMPCDNVTLTAEFELIENEVGSFISEGNLWIIITVSIVAIGCATFFIIKKKKAV